MHTTDRKALIRLASTLPVGSDERKVILAGLRGASTKTAMNYHTDLNAARAKVNDRYIKELARVIAWKTGGKYHSERENELIVLGDQWLELRWRHPSAQEFEVKWYDGKNITKVSVEPGFVDRQSTQLIRDSLDKRR